MSFAYGGFCFAAAFTFPICAMLCKNFGWPFIFYVTGGFGLLVAFIAYFVAYDWPEDHPRISERELVYIQKTRAVQHTSRKASKVWGIFIFKDFYSIFVIFVSVS